MNAAGRAQDAADYLRRRRRRQRTADAIARVTVSGMIVGSVLFLLLPLALTLSMSFDARDYLGAFPPPALSLRWYTKFFSDPYLLKGLQTSVQLAALTALFATALGLSAAVALERMPRRQAQFLGALFLSPLIVPGVVVGFALLIFYARVGVESTFLRLLGGHVLITFPYAIRTVLAALGGIRPSLTEVAQSLGAGPTRAFWTVTFPLARTGIAAGAIFAFVFSLDDVAVSLFLSDPERYTLPVALVSMLHANFDLTIAAVAVLIMGSSIALMLLLDWLAGLDRVVGAGYYKT
ncbi:MAG TPA: ABC transporter permease [Casimicrobiaceae bacterium]|jgi:putative spermidine/putrescine transport system permease protein|nr:ABC transporter permease [Casimicrobiaceae bacterium]